MTKKLDTLVEDIYDLMKNRNTEDYVDVDAEIEKFGEAMKSLMKKEFKPYEGPRDGRRLRLSAIGKPDRQLWYSYNKFRGEKIQPHTFIKFMYGHMIEEMLLFFVRMAGHEVTGEQKHCEVEGVRGSMDCRIDGTVIDVKSTSTFGFKKFKDGTLATDDPFGYIDQIKAYAHSEGEEVFGWLAMDKANGHLCVLKHDMKDTSDPMYEHYGHDIEERVRNIKEFVKKEEKPAQCYTEVPDGKSGNMKLATGCSYCQYKKHCFPTLRAFSYSTGPKFLTKVSNLPRVPELDLTKGDF